MIRIAFLDTEFERCVPHVLSDATECSGMLVVENKPVEFGYTTSHVVRQATAEDMEQWRQQ